MEKIKKRLTIWCAIISLAVFSLRGLLFTPGQIGHNWDFIFPYLKNLFINIPDLSINTWWAYDLGQVNHFNTIQLLSNYLLSFLVLVFGSILSTKLLILIIIITSIISFTHLLNYLTQKSARNIGFGLLYGFSPFLFNEIIGGAWYQWVSFATIPWFILSTIQLTTQKNNFKSLLIFIFSSLFAFNSIHHTVSIQVILILYLIYLAYVNKKFKSYVIRYFSIHLLLIPIHSFWILPMIGSFQTTFTQHVLTSEFAGDLAGVIKSTQNLTSILNLSGYYDRNMYYFAISKFWQPLFNLVGFLIAFLIILIFYVSKSRRQLIPWLIIFILAFPVIKGGNPPFGDITIWVYRHVRLMNIYRSPQHLMFIPAFLTPLIITISYHLISQSNQIKLTKQLPIYKYKNHIYILLLITIGFWISGWWINGDLGHHTFREQNGNNINQKRDYIDFFQLPPELIETYTISENDPEIHRLLFIPALNSPKYLPTPYQNIAQGGQPEHLYLKNSTLEEEHNPIARLFNEHFCGLQRINWVNLASITNIKYISVRSDIYPWYSKCQGLWDINKAHQEIDSHTSLTKVIDGKYTQTYQIKPENFLPKIYPATQIIQTEQEFAKIISQKDFKVSTAIYAKNHSIPSIADIQPPETQIKQINSTKYRVVIKNATTTFPLIFSENFHPGWKLYLVDLPTNGLLKTDPFWETWFKTPIAEDQHFQVNTFANSWFINPQELCDQPDNLCIQHPDHSYDLQLVIEYWNQRMFYWGLIISILSISAIIIITTYTRIILLRF